MKKSHRKDVMIARIIFACMVLILVAIIVFGAQAVMKYRQDRKPQQEEAGVGTEMQTPETETEEETPFLPAEDDNDQWIVDDTETEEGTASGEDGESAESDQVILKALYGVNIRSGAGKDYPVVGGVEEGTTIILLEDQENGWGYIQQGDLTGYVYLNYFEVVDSAE